jgi:hypothetical protein
MVGVEQGDEVKVRLGYTTSTSKRLLNIIRQQQPP